MKHTVFQAGAAEVSIHQMQVEAFLRTGRVFGKPAHEQKLRCLVFAHEAALVIIFDADWGHWFRGDDAVRQAVEQLVPNRPVQVFCFGTGANHDIDLDACLTPVLDERDKHHDPLFRQAFVQAAVDVFNDATRHLRPASVTAGQGHCGSVTLNSLRPSEPTDSTVHILRIADDEDKLIAVVVNFSCRSDDVEPELSAGIPGSLETLVQKVYGPVPVLFFNSAGGEFYKAMRHIPPFRNGDGKEEARQRRGETLTREMDRIGRVLGGETCKVLAELEVAGEPLEAQNQRALQTAWITRAVGQRLCSPQIIARAVPLRLSCVTPRTVEVCEKHLHEIEAELKPLTKKLPFTPTGNVPLPVEVGDTSSDAFRWMELRAARYYWAAEAGRAKLMHRHGRHPRTFEGVAQILAFSHSLVVIALPAHMYARQTATWKERSPFAITQVWAGMAPLSWMCVIPPEEQTLGGQHSGMALAPEDIETLTDHIIEALQETYKTLRK